MDFEEIESLQNDENNDPLKNVYVKIIFVASFVFVFVLSFFGNYHIFYNR
jgi:hypothetical protein